MRGWGGWGARSGLERYRRLIAALIPAGPSQPVAMPETSISPSNQPPPPFHLLLILASHG